ncbi:MAG TPA: PEP-CTERM sorting domain-containing protein [Bryobacteraceae bacterium]|nr:PEP-CTERM sorting domain-containing protein [Bryobacteraceae bacterium]
MRSQICQIAAAAAFLAGPIVADPIFFSTGNPDGKIAADSRPASSGKFEIETGDDFVLSTEASINGASFTGLLTGGVTSSDIAGVRVEIYRVFPDDSDVGRTTGAPDFITPNVPTRVNSPSDVELDDRDSASGGLTFTTGIINGTFTAANSVQPGGIHPKPGDTTGGNGAITGTEVQFNVTFTTPFDLLADHYFFVPQVEIASPDGEFYWLSAPRPIVPPGTAFPSGSTDLQAWTRDQFLDPDWLRVGTDIVGGNPAPTFNMAFTLSGDTVSSVPEPSSIIVLGTGMLAILGIGRKRRLPRR